MFVAVGEGKAVGGGEVGVGVMVMAKGRWVASAGGEVTVMKITTAVGVADGLPTIDKAPAKAMRPIRPITATKTKAHLNVGLGWVGINGTIIFR